MGMTPRCEGRLRIQSRRRTKTVSNGDTTSDSGSLSDQTWYFCVLSAEEPDMRWFESSDQAPPLAVTQVSKLYALDQAAESAQAEASDDPTDDAERERMLCIEDEAAGMLYVCQADTVDARDKWRLAFGSELSDKRRSLLRLKASHPDMDDAFGLLSLTRSSLAADAQQFTAAPGFWAVDRVDEATQAANTDDYDEDEDENVSIPASTRPLRAATTGSINRQSMTQATGKDHCRRCQKRIGGFFRARVKVCTCCSHHFCKDHCYQVVSVASLPGQKSAPSLVCGDCATREQFISSISEIETYYQAIVQCGGLSKLVQWQFFSTEPKQEVADYIQANEFGPMNLLSAMFKFRQHPYMFFVLLAQWVKTVEFNIDMMDFYWPQILHWGFVYLEDAPPSAQTFYLFFLAAVSRRCVHFGMKTTWECIPAHWDAMEQGGFARARHVLMMFYYSTHVSFGKREGVFEQLLFESAPLHQNEALARRFEAIFDLVQQIYSVTPRESPFFSWLLAQSEEEIKTSSSFVRHELFRCQDFLDPCPNTSFDYERRLSAANKPEARVPTSVLNAPAMRIFSDGFQLARYLVDLATYLKYYSDKPAMRKRRLPALLLDMHQGQAIRPDSYLPLLKVTSPLHRVVNVLTDEGTVFSTRVRAPTLLFFEVIASDLGDVALADCFRLEDHTRESVFDRHSRNFRAAAAPTGDVATYLDTQIVESYASEVRSGRNPDEVIREAGSDVSGSGADWDIEANCSEELPCEPSQPEDENVVMNLGTLSSTSSWQRAGACPYFGERFEVMQNRIREQSPFAQYGGWALLPVIAKSFDDMRQEVFILQGLKTCQLIFQKHSLHNIWLRDYRITCIGKDCGLLEVIVNAQSIDALKKKGLKRTSSASLVAIFEEACGRNPETGELDTAILERARQNFISSMAAYSLFCYVFAIKDRHNGNVMIDVDGHVIHIDFGFVLGIAPGNKFSIETAPFKLTKEMVDIMGPSGFDQFKELIQHGLRALHLEAKQIVALVSLSSIDSSFPCFCTGMSRARILRHVERRLCVGRSLEDVAYTATRIVDKSYDHMGTNQYDWFQQRSNGIAA